MATELTQEQQERLKKFDPHKPLVINPAEISGLEAFVGKFVFKRVNIKDRLQIGIQTAKLKQTQELDVFYDNLAYVLATLQTVCTEKPFGFEFEECMEVESLFILFERYNEWVEFFRLSIPTTKDAASQEGKS
jgi:hypothetical protein